MPRKRFGAEQAVTKLRQVDVLMGEGKNLEHVIRGVALNMLATTAGARSMVG